MISLRKGAGFISAFAAVCGATIATAEPVGWSRFPAVVAEALGALRNSENPLGDIITMNADGPRTGRRIAGEEPMNFDPTRHLSWLVVDLNGDGRPEVFLLIEFSTGSGAPWGVVMQQSPAGWRVACEFQHEAWASRRDGRPGLRNRPVALQDRRSLGWRHFTVLDGTYGWRHVEEAGGAYCVRLIERPTRLIEQPPP